LRNCAIEVGEEDELGIGLHRGESEGTHFEGSVCMLLEKFLASVLTTFFSEEMSSVIGSVSSRPGVLRLVVCLLGVSGILGVVRARRYC
jgi:hypothetical protein